MNDKKLLFKKTISVAGNNKKKRNYHKICEFAMKGGLEVKVSSIDIVVKVCHLQKKITENIKKKFYDFKLCIKLVSPVWVSRVYPFCQRMLVVGRDYAINNIKKLDNFII